jgi:hypothetical protein
MVVYRGLTMEAILKLPTGGYQPNRSRIDEAAIYDGLVSKAKEFGMAYPDYFFGQVAAEISRRPLELTDTKPLVDVVIYELLNDSLHGGDNRNKVFRLAKDTDELDRRVDMLNANLILKECASCGSELEVPKDLVDRVCEMKATRSVDIYPFNEIHIDFLVRPNGFYYCSHSCEQKFMQWVEILKRFRTGASLI